MWQANYLRTKKKDYFKNLNAKLLKVREMKEGKWVHPYGTL